MREHSPERQLQEPTWSLKINSADSLVPEYAKGEQPMFGDPPSVEEQEALSREATALVEDFYHHFTPHNRPF